MSSSFTFFIIKAVISGVLVAMISSIAKAFPKWAALVTALPTITFLSLVWIYLDKKDLKLLETYTFDVLLWTIPSFIFFLVLILMFRANIPFLISLICGLGSLALGIYFLQKLGILR